MSQRAPLKTGTRPVQSCICTCNFNWEDKSNMGCSWCSTTHQKVLAMDNQWWSPTCLLSQCLQFAVRNGLQWEELEGGVEKREAIASDHCGSAYRRTIQGTCWFLFSKGEIPYYWGLNSMWLTRLARWGDKGSQERYWRRTRPLALLERTMRRMLSKCWLLRRQLLVGMLANWRRCWV